MAISDDLPGVKVSVAANGADLQEYRDEDLEEEAGTTTRFIQAVTGQTFEVRITVERGFQFAGDTLACYITLDGQSVHTPLICQENCRSQSYCRTSSGATARDGMLRRYQFAKLEVNDDRMTTEDAEKFKELGTIKVRMAHRRKTKLMERNDEAKFADLLTVPEKALKGQAVSHRAQLQAAVPAAKSTVWNLELVPGFEGDAASFVFKYRSLENLKVQRIIPRTPTPPPLEDRDVETLTAEELRELQRRAREFRDDRETKVKIKRENDDDGPRRRRIARPSASSTQLELDDEGRFRQSSTPTVTHEPEVIELD